MSSKRLLLVCALAACVSWASVARSEEPLPRLVEVEILGEDDEASRLEATLRELLGRVDLVLVRVPASEHGPLLSHATIDLRSSAVARIVVVAGRDNHVIMERDLVRNATPSVAREEIAHAVTTAVEAELLEREAPPAPPPPPVAEPERPPPPPAPTPAEPPSRSDVAAQSKVTVDVTTIAAVGPIAAESGIAPRVGGGFIVALGSKLRPAIGVSAAYAPAFDAGDGIVASRVSFVGVRMMPSIELLRGSRLALDVGVGGGLDVLSVSPRSDVLPTSAMRSSTTHVDPIVSSMVTLRVRLVPSVTLLASAGADFDLLTRAYVVDHGWRQEDIFTPWRVRPAFMLGFAFTAWGGT